MATPRPFRKGSSSLMALEAIKGIWASSSRDVAEQLDAAIPSFFEDRSIGRKAPLQALEHLGHTRLLERVASGLLKVRGPPEENHVFCLQMFERLQSQSDSKYVVECLVKAIFHPSTRQYPLDALEGNLKCAVAALKTVAQRDYAAVVTQVAERLRPSEDAWLRSRAAELATAFAVRDDERMVTAIQECLDENLSGCLGKLASDHFWGTVPTNLGSFNEFNVLKCVKCFSYRTYWVFIEELPVQSGHLLSSDFKFDQSLHQIPGR